ncbi:MAG: hypothetical protein AAGD09_07945 [Cyanobacteria bacterium P01_F01_bin.56]
MTRFSMYFQGACLLALTTGFWTNVTSQQAGRVAASSLEMSQGQLTDDSLPPLLIIDAQRSDVTVRVTRPIPNESSDDQLSPQESPPVSNRESPEPALVRSVRVSPTGQVIASSDDEDDIQIWDIATGEQLYIWPGGKSRRTQAVDFTPDGQTILGGSIIEGKLRIWHWQENSRLVTPPLDNIFSLNVSPDGQFIATGHSRGKINLWTQDFELIRSIQAYDSAIVVVAVEFAPNGLTLASRGFGPPGTTSGVKLFDVSTGTEKERLSSESSGGIDENGGHSIAYSPDGNILAGYYGVASDIVSVRLWNPITSEVIADLQTEVTQPHAIAFSSDGQFMAVAGLSDLIEVWDVQNREVVQTFTSGLGFHHVYSIDFVPDSRTFVTSGVADLEEAERRARQGTIMTWALSCDDVNQEASQVLNTWSETVDVEIDRVITYPASNGEKAIEIFYRTHEELQQFSQDGTSERLRAEAISAASALGCYEAQTLDWQVSFQSFDFVLENYQGSYQFYYQR